MSLTFAKKVRRLDAFLYGALASIQWCPQLPEFQIQIQLYVLHPVKASLHSLFVPTAQVGHRINVVLTQMDVTVLRHLVAACLDSGVDRIEPCPIAVA